MKKNRKKTFWLNGFKSIKKQKKIFLFVTVCIFVFFVIFCGGMIASSLTTNIYGITDLNENIDNLKVGDTINYNINGYSDWKVLNVDKNSGTVEVTSNTNVKDLEIEPYKTVDEYNQLFQTEADGFLDNNYVVSARTINKSDLSLLNDNSDQEFWLANVNENTLMTNKNQSDSKNSAIWTKSTYDIQDFYVIPYIGVINQLGYIPDVGSKISFSSNGIDTWIYSGQKSPYGVYEGYGEDRGKEVLLYIPEYPVLLHTDSMENVGNVVSNYFESFNKAGIRDYGNYLSKFPENFHDTILKYISKNSFYNKDEVMYFVSGIGNGVESTDQKYNIKKTYRDYEAQSSYSNRCYDKGSATDGFYKCNIEIYKLDTNDLNSAKPSLDVSTFYEPKTLTFGYRPVLNLKISGEKKGMRLSNSIDVGDYVDYEAGNYKNWRVLSINNENGTVDIISGGIVKNLSLYGIEDYNEYENILQREVDMYKNGDNAIAARSIQESDISLLKMIDDNVGGSYWFNRKTQRRLDTYENVQTSTIVNEISYDVGVLKLEKDSYGDFYHQGYWVRLYSHAGNNPDNQAYLGGDNLNYIAGLRPIITLKIEKLKELSKDDIDEVKSGSINNDNKIIKYQNQNNNYSVIRINNYNSSSDGNKTDSGDILPYVADNGVISVVFDMGDSNLLLKIMFIFIYGLIFAIFCAILLICLIKARYS